MLILTRRKFEKIIVAPGSIAEAEPEDVILFSLLGVLGRQVRLGIDAHDEIEIHRFEIAERQHWPIVEKLKAAGRLPYHE